MPIQTIDAATLKSWLEKGEAALIDVREPGEHAASSIPGAKLLPLSGISRQALSEFAGKKLVIHCQAGKRGGTACEKLLAEDPALEIYNLEGGIAAWIAAGNAVKTSGKCFLPLDRQVQLTVGLGLLLSVLLGYTIASGFFLLCAVFGAGLTFAGLTGHCGLAKLLAKAPWNTGCTTASASCCAGK